MNYLNTNIKIYLNNFNKSLKFLILIINFQIFGQRNKIYLNVFLIYNVERQNILKVKEEET